MSRFRLTQDLLQSKEEEKELGKGNTSFSPSYKSYLLSQCAPEGKKEAGIISLDELIVRVSLSDCATIAGLALDFCSTEMDFLNKTPFLFLGVYPYFYSDL